MPTIHLHTFDDFIEQSIRHPHARFSVKNGEAVLIDGEDDKLARLKGGLRDFRVFVSSHGNKEVARAVLAKQMADWLYEKAQELPEDNPFRYFGAESITSSSNKGIHNVVEKLEDRVRDIYPDASQDEVTEHIRKIRTYEQRVWASSIKRIPANYTWAQVNATTNSGSNISLTQAVQNNMAEANGLAYLTPLPPAVKESMVAVDEMAIALSASSSKDLIAKGYQKARHILFINDSLKEAYEGQHDIEARQHGAFSHKSFDDATKNYFAIVDVLNQRRSSLKKQYDVTVKLSPADNSQRQALADEIQAIDRFVTTVTEARLTLKNINSMRTAYWSMSGFPKQEVQAFPVFGTISHHVDSEPAMDIPLDPTHDASRYFLIKNKVIAELNKNRAFPVAQRKPVEDILQKYVREGVSVDTINHIRLDWELNTFSTLKFDQETTAMVEQAGKVQFHAKTALAIQELNKKVTQLQTVDSLNYQRLIEAYQNRLDALTVAYNTMIENAISQAVVYSDDPNHVFIPKGAVGNSEILSSKGGSTAIPREVIEAVTQKYLATELRDAPFEARFQAGLLGGDVYSYKAYHDEPVINQVIIALYQEHQNREATIGNTEVLQHRFLAPIRQDLKTYSDKQLDDLFRSLNDAIEYVERYQPRDGENAFDPKVATRLAAYSNAVADEQTIRAYLASTQKSKPVEGNNDDFVHIEGVLTFNREAFIQEHYDKVEPLFKDFGPISRAKIIEHAKEAYDAYVAFSKDERQPKLNVELVAWVANDYVYRQAQARLVDAKALDYLNIYAGIVTEDVSADLEVANQETFNNQRYLNNPNAVASEADLIRELLKQFNVHPANKVALQERASRLSNIRIPSLTRAPSEPLIDIDAPIQPRIRVAMPDSTQELKVNKLRLTEARDQLTQRKQEYAEVSMRLKELPENDFRGRNHLFRTSLNLVKEIERLSKIIDDVEKRESELTFI